MRSILPATQGAFRRPPPRHALAAVGSACALILLTALAACGPGGHQQASTASKPGPAVTSRSQLPAGTASLPEPAATPTRQPAGAPGYQLPAGTSAHTIKFGGVKGYYRTYRPASLPARAPLVVMLHGSGASASQAERDYHWDAEADSGHFIVAYPDYYLAAKGFSANAESDMYHFISAVIAAIKRHNPIDSSRFYAAGISAGGIDAYAMTCLTTIFAAIGVDSGIDFGNCPHPAPVSVIHIHGTADHIFRYHEPPGPGLPSIPQVNAAWRRIDHCAAPAVSTTGTVTTSIAACQAGRTVELITIAGAGHQWPGGATDPGIGGDPPSTALNATQVIWEFFAKHHR